MSPSKQELMSRRQAELERSQGTMTAQVEQVSVDTAIAFQAARAMQDQPPRVLAKVTERVIEEFELGGEDMYYSWRQKSKESKDKDGKVQIEGIGRDGAMALMRNFGRCTCVPRLESETRQAFQFSAAFVDFETGAVVTRLYLKRKTNPPGNIDEQRWLDILFSDGQSRVMRNAILDGMPTHVKREALAAAKRGAKKGLTREKPLKKRLDELVELFKKDFDVPLAMLEQNLDVPRKEWTEDHGLTLADLLRALRAKDTTVDEVFPPEPPPEREPGQEG